MTSPDLHIAAILFDMDGVIIDTHDSVTAYWHTLAEQHGVTLTEDDFKTHIYGSPLFYSLDRLFPHLTAEQRQAAADYLYVYETEQLQYPAIPGVVDLLRSLRGRVPVALVTSGDRAKVHAVFDQLDLHDLFDARVTAEDVTTGKPDPACYLLGAERVGVDPARCVVFEDSRNGAQAGLSAGCTVIGVQPPEDVQPLLDLGARHVIRDFADATINGDVLTLPPDVRVRWG
ncbi:MAG: HAD family phosphatase [Anaerolineae bacterium]|nr:HAD family phosphatase [Anaerolineae bacterium]